MSCSEYSLDTYENLSEIECLTQPTYNLANNGGKGGPRRNHIIGNLLERELNGKFSGRVASYNNDKSGIFGRSIPARLSMPIDSVVPAYALENGNIFMGFTKCGRYLLSYSSRPSDAGLWNRTGDLTFVYKLNFWLFTPYAKAREIYNVHLFENQTILHDNLLIEIAQWPYDNNKLIIIGRSLNPTTSCTDSLTYITIATIPDAKPCSNCSYAPPEEDEEYTEATFLLKPCMNHGLTIHLAHDQVEPYPAFEPKIQLKYKDTVFFNTGNIFHMFSILSVAPNEESSFKKELLYPPKHAASPNEMKKRHLRCDYWFKNDQVKPTTISLATIMKNCSTIISNKNELNRFIKNAKFSELENEENILSINKQSLLLKSLSSANPPCIALTTKRRLSVSSCESELSIKTSDEQNQIEIACRDHKNSSPKCTSSLSWSWKSDSNNSATVVEPNCTSLESKTTSRPAKMLPPQTRKFFKELRRVLRKSPAVPVPVSSSQTAQTPTSNTIFDVFEVKIEDPIEYHSFSSFRKKKLADKKYEFSDEFDDQMSMTSSSSASATLIPRQSRFPRKRAILEDKAIDENLVTSPFDSGEPSPRSDTSIQLGNASPKSHQTNVSPAALSPNYSNSSDVLRSITNNPPVSYNLSPSPGILESSNKMMKDEEECLEEVKHTSTDRDKETFQQQPKRSEQEEQQTNSRPTFSASVNCIAKILRCYAETEEDDNMSVRTESDDEYNVTLPFPVALVLNVLGKDNQQLSMISNSKVKFCPKQRIEILQRSIDIEILCNEVATMICLASGKYFCSCFDYDVAFIDVCSESGEVTALALVLFSATSLKRFQQERYATYNYDIPCGIPGIPDPRKKYEAMFSFIWNPIQERARILYLGNLVEMQTVPEPWNPTRIMAPHAISVLNKQPACRMTLRNDLAVTDAQSVYELKDFNGIITLYRKETNHERQQRLRAEAKLRNQRILSSTATSATTSEEDEDDFANFSMNSDISTD